MRSLYTLYNELEQAIGNKNYCIKHFGLPNGWDHIVRGLEAAIQEAQLMTSKDVSESLKGWDTKTIVWSVMDIRNGEEGRQAELELLDRLAHRQPATQNGPAQLVGLDDNGGLTFTSLAPWETCDGLFLAYDVGYYD